MAGAKEIRTKIASVSSTQKITSAMEKVATSKMRKAQVAMARGKPYAERIRSVVGHIANAAPEYKHLYLQEREIKRVGYVVISSDRGLCGGLNTNLFKSVLMQLREFQAQGVEVHLTLIGSKGLAFFRRLKLPVVSSITHLGDRPHLADLIGTIKVQLDMYLEGKTDRLFLVHNRFVNTMSQKAESLQLLPAIVQDAGDLQDRWDYIYEPSAAELLEGYMTRYIESQVYQAAVENVACEMASRMVAMKSASDNAGKLIDELQLVYNKARQAAITKELAEIVGGAAAV